MSEAFEVIVVGLGVMGAAAADELSRRGLRVLGLDQYRSPHSFGSSHGRSRIIREAYFEHPLYVPLVQRAYQRWRALEEESGKPLLEITGGLMLGPADGTLVPGARRSALAHGLPHEELSATEIRRRFPAFNVSEEFTGLYESRAGVLDPEACVEALLGSARALGADLRFDERVIEWRSQTGGVTVRTSTGTYGAGRLVLAVGPWLGDLWQQPGFPLSVERQLMVWLRPRSSAEIFRSDRFPVFIWEWVAGRYFYGIPDQGHGVKVARHHEGASSSVEKVQREVTPAEVTDVRDLVSRFLPEAAGELIDSMACLYTNAPDDHFVVDHLPGHAAVVVASPCSGHGFKFAPTIGELVADLVVGAESGFDISPFSASRAALSGTT